MAKCPVNRDDRDQRENHLLDHKATFEWTIKLIQFGQLVEKAEFSQKPIDMQEDQPIRILDKSQIKRKIKRLAIQIMEQNYGDDEIILAGINKNGYYFAELLRKELKNISDCAIRLTRITLNPAKPVVNPIALEMEVKELKNKTVIVVDDVANTGRTLFYAIEPLLKTLPRKVEMAVLVDRTHKSFPLRADYVGTSLATTLQENIIVHIRDTKDWGVYLD